MEEPLFGERINSEPVLTEFIVECVVPRSFTLTIAGLLFEKLAEIFFSSPGYEFIPEKSLAECSVKAVHFASITYEGRFHASSTATFVESEQMRRDVIDFLAHCGSRKMKITTAQIAEN